MCGAWWQRRAVELEPRRASYGTDATPRKAVGCCAAQEPALEILTLLRRAWNTRVDSSPRQQVAVSHALACARQRLPREAARGWEGFTQNWGEGGGTVLLSPLFSPCRPSRKAKGKSALAQGSSGRRSTQVSASRPGLSLLLRSVGWHPCWWREGVLGAPPSTPGRLGKMLGPREAPSEVGTVRGDFGAKGRVVGSSRLGSSWSGGLPADPRKEPAWGCALAAGWVCSPAPTLVGPPLSAQPLR